MILQTATEVISTHHFYSLYFINTPAIQNHSAKLRFDQ